MNDSANANFLPGESHLEPIGVCAILVLGLLILFLQRRHAIIPMLVLACFIPGQDLVVATMHFGGIRILVVFGMLRVLSIGEWKKIVWQRLDTLLVLFALSGTLVYVLQYGTLDALKFRLGQMYDIVGMYFLFRSFIRSWEDIASLAKAFSVISIFVAAAFVLERSTGHNLFAAFGGVPAVTMVRDGKFRCQGAFSHPILAGCFWASLLPIMGALWWRDAAMRTWAIVGVSCGFVIVFLCSSSTPLSAVIFGLIGALFFRFRRSMRQVRWALVGVLILIQLIMKGPIWGLVARMDLFGGSTGYYRFTLIDASIWHFGEWWFLGIQDVGPWGNDYNHYVSDITDQYVLEGTRGGVWTLGLFVAMIVTAFSILGRIRLKEERIRENLVMTWALGVSLLVHSLIFFGVSYFGQIISLWYLTLAMIGSLSEGQKISATKTGARLRGPGRLPVIPVSNAELS
jgi:hypothetical protein